MPITHTATVTTYNIVLMGSAESGKTRFVHQLMGDPCPEEYNPTWRKFKLTAIPGRRARFNITELGSLYPYELVPCIIKLADAVFLFCSKAEFERGSHPLIPLVLAYNPKVRITLIPPEPAWGLVASYLYDL